MDIPLARLPRLTFTHGGQTRCGGRKAATFQHIRFVNWGRGAGGGGERAKVGPRRIAPRAGLNYLQQSPQPLGQQVVQEPSLQQSPQADFSCEVWAKAVTARTRTSENNAMVRFIRISLGRKSAVELAEYKSCPEDKRSQGASFAWDVRKGLDPENAEQDVSLEP